MTGSAWGAGLVGPAADLTAPRVTIAADSEHLGARVGITSVLHTWGSALMLRWLGRFCVSTVSIIRVPDKKTGPAELRVLIWKAPIDDGADGADGIVARIFV